MLGSGATPFRGTLHVRASRPRALGRTVLSKPEQHGPQVLGPTWQADSGCHVATIASFGSSALARSYPTAVPANVVAHLQSPGASGPVEIWRRVEITVTSGQYLACSSANFR